MIDLLLLSVGPVFLAGSIALAVWTDLREGRSGHRPDPERPGSAKATLRLVR